jgi:hypothetical protein
MAPVCGEFSVRGGSLSVLEASDTTDPRGLVIVLRGGVLSVKVTGDCCGVREGRLTATSMVVDSGA